MPPRCQIPAVAALSDTNAIGLSPHDVSQILIRYMARTLNVDPDILTVDLYGDGHAEVFEREEKLTGEFEVRVGAGRL